MGLMPAGTLLPEPAWATGRGWTRLRHKHEAPRRGRYRALVVRNEQLAFARERGDEVRVVALNASDNPAELGLPVAGTREAEGFALLEPQRRFLPSGGRLQLGSMRPTSGRVPRRG